ncbi:amidohydrolase family protein [Favolaschia claudopus]|uniref:Amidohydrolase family protein n=1 Tax=Favolaschia claudopus TaxID=2862362 RepID=A0AAW0A9P8_9AGAR
MSTNQILDVCSFPGERYPAYNVSGPRGNKCTLVKYAKYRIIVDRSKMISNRLLLHIYTLSTILQGVIARPWHDTGTGTIIFEEAWSIPALVNQATRNVPIGTTSAELTARLLDIHNERLAHMDANGVDYMVISCAQPCIQGISDPVMADDMARSVNDQLAAQIANNTLRFGGFAALSMHNATSAAQELKRAVVELGFLGALINDYQQSGPDNETLLFYDQPEYDVFWEMVVALDVPVYLHPRTNIAQIQNLLYGHAPWLEAASQEFADTLSTHIMGLCTNGVFDRYPNLTVIVGHLGERISSDFWRINDQLARQVPIGMPMLKNLSSYWESGNVLETTSGNFATELFEFHVSQFGKRIMYSVDYPFVTMEQGAAWLKGLSETMDIEDLQALKRELAIEVLHLNR